MTTSDQLDHPVYFLTWTTYGTWLPGDERGWVDRTEASGASPIREFSENRLAQARERLRSEPVVLDDEERDNVERTIAEVCEHRGWPLYAVNCRTNHVHVVLLATERTPEFTMNSLKSWCSRRLNEQREDAPPEKWWTRHGSTRWLKEVAAFEQVVDYVRNRQ